MSIFYYMKLYKILLIRTEFIIQQDRNFDEDYVLFLKQIQQNPGFNEFLSEIDEDIREFSVTPQEIQSSMKSMIPVF